MKYFDKVVVQVEEKKEWSGPYVVEEDLKVNNEVKVRIRDSFKLDRFGRSYKIK